LPSGARVAARRCLQEEASRATPVADQGGTDHERRFVAGIGSPARLLHPRCEPAHPARSLIVSTPVAPGAWILDGIRTPFVKAGDAFRHTPVYELGRVAMGEVLARANLDPARIDEVVFGNCAQPAEALNVSPAT